MSFSHHRASSNELYGKLKILKLKDQVFLKNCLFVYDALTKNLPSCFSEYFTVSKNIHSLRTRGATNNYLFVCHRATMKYGIQSITAQCISNWNAATKSLNQDLLLLSRKRLIFLLKNTLFQAYV